MSRPFVRGPSHEGHRVRAWPTLQHLLTRASPRDQNDSAFVLDRPAVVLRIIEELLGIRDICPDTDEQAKTIPWEFCAARPVWPHSFSFDGPPHRIGCTGDEQRRSIELPASISKPGTSVLGGIEARDDQSGWGSARIQFRDVM